METFRDCVTQLSPYQAQISALGSDEEESEKGGPAITCRKKVHLPLSRFEAPFLGILLPRKHFTFIIPQPSQRIQGCLYNMDLEIRKVFHVPVCLQLKELFSERQGALERDPPILAPVFSVPAIIISRKRNS